MAAKCGTCGSAAVSTTLADEVSCTVCGANTPAHHYVDLPSEPEALDAPEPDAA